MCLGVGLKWRCPSVGCGSVLLLSWRVGRPLSSSSALASSRLFVHVWRTTLENTRDTSVYLDMTMNCFAAETLFFSLVFRLFVFFPKERLPAAARTFAAKFLQVPPDLTSWSRYRPNLKKKKKRWWRALRSSGTSPVALWIIHAQVQLFPVAQISSGVFVSPDCLILVL